MHSNETVVVLHALKDLLTRIEVLETRINEVRDTISRIEQVGLTFNIEALGEEDEDSDDEDSVASAPF
jgi:hypothetical protein